MSDSNEQPSEATREQMEAHVVAILLWETSSFEKAQLQQQIRDDERLASCGLSRRRTTDHRRTFAFQAKRLVGCCVR